MGEVKVSSKAFAVKSRPPQIKDADIEVPGR